MRRTAAILAAIGLVAFSAGVRAQSWELVRNQGMIKLVLISKAKERDDATYEDAVRRLCPADRHCGVQFWSDRRSIPSGLLSEMSDAQENARLATYIQNPKTGVRELVYHCRIKFDPNYCR
jgi:hypothetical protein